MSGAAELLSSNANVLGVDSIPAHKTKRFSNGSHFQFFHCGKGSSPSREEVIEYAKGVCLRDDIGFLIDVLGETDIGKGLMREVVGVMQMLRMKL